MTKLYALPDHEVMENLLPSIRDQELPVDAAIERLREQPGLVPIAINPAGSGLVYFADIGDTPLVEWKYIYTIQRLAEENAIKEMFVTDLSILDQKGLASDGITPDGFIFHVSRCGSTLFTKALARSPYNLTVSQGGPLQEGFWAVVSDHWQHEPAIDERNIRLFRNLVLLMTRKRRPEYRRAFVKFISWNIIYLDFILAAFPDTPSIYLYRDPVEVIATVLQETTAVLRSKGQLLSHSLTGLSPDDTAGMSDIEYLAHCYANYFNIVQHYAGGDRLHLINYKKLVNPGQLADILFRSFNLKTGDTELLQMSEQYRYDSKDDSDSRLFSGDSAAILGALSAGDRQIIREICGKAVAGLDASERNLYPSE